MSPHDILVVILIGVSAGLLSGLVGVGGGIILVPAMVYFLGYTQQQAQGTSLGIMVFPITLVAFITYYNEAKQIGTPIDFKIVGIVCAGFIVGSFFGTLLTFRIDKDLMKKLFALLLFYSAFKMLAWDTAIFRWIKNIFTYQ